MKNYILDNAETRNALAPRTFQIPTRATRDSIQPGDFVKLLFQLLDGSDEERMWVNVQRVMGNSFMGLLNNQPISDEFGLDLGDEITFGPENIAEVGPKEWSRVLTEKECVGENP